MTDEKQEFINFINPNSGADFPYLVLDAINENSYPQTPGFHVMHWHEDLHFIYVLSGSIFMKTLEENVHLSACEVLVALCTLRLSLRDFDDAVRARMRASLGYIQEYYGEAISLSQLAQVPT